MSDWRYEARRLNGDGTSTLIDPELPLKGVGLTTVLSGPAGLTASLDPAMTRLMDRGGKSLLRPYSTGIFAVQDESIHSGFILTQAPQQGESMSLTGVGFSGYPQGKVYYGDKFFVQIDPLDVVRHIWSHLQSRPGYNLGMVLGSTKVGKLIGTELKQVEFDTVNGPVSFEAGPVKLNWWETDDLGGKITDLAKDHPFDYEESYVRAANGDIVPHLTFGVPRIGTRRNNLRFVEGENIIVTPGVDYNDESYASEVFVRGAGEGRTMILGHAVRGGETRLARPVVVEDKSIKSVTNANARAKEELDRRTGAGEISEITVRGTHDTPIGAASNGDEIEIHTESPWGPVSAWHRIVSTTINPQDLGEAKFALMRADMIAP